MLYDISVVHLLLDKNTKKKERKKHASKIRSQAKAKKNVCRAFYLNNCL